MAGGGIVLLKDAQPDAEGEFIQLTASLDAPPPPAPVVPAEDVGAAMAVDDGPEAEMPAPYQVSGSL